MIFQPYVINPNTPPGTYTLKQNKCVNIELCIIFFLLGSKKKITEGEAMLEHLLKKFGPEGSERFTREGSKLKSSICFLYL